MKERKYTFSIIVPVYNTEEYLHDTINSIIDQKVGFKEHIQLILINDGSTDASEDICLYYKNKYPDNIVYKYKENGGVSSACNLGLELAEGEYINFFGSDDIWSKDAFWHVNNFFDSEEGSEVDIVSLKLEFFGAYEGPHVLNYKYKKTKVVDLKEEYDYVQLMNGNCVIRREATKGMKYNESINYMEDALFINEILLKKCKYAVLSDGVYHIRKREDDSSLSTFMKKSGTERYLVTPAVVWNTLFDMSIKTQGEIMRFIQYSVMYEMQWRFSEKLPLDMSDADIKEYTSLLIEVLHHIDDEIIFRQHSLRVRDRVFVYKLKYGDDFFKNIKWKKGRAYYNDTKVYTLLSTNRLYWMTMEFSDSQILLQGITDIGDLGLPFKIWIKDNKGNFFDVKTERFPPKDFLAYNRSILSEGIKIEARIPLCAGSKYSFYVQIGDSEPYNIKAGFGWNAKLNHLTKNSYCCYDKYIIKLIGKKICIYDYSKKMHIASELRYLKAISKYAKGFDHKYKEKVKPYIWYRILFYIQSLFASKKEKWLIIDRVSNATDNGASLFKYAGTVNDKSRKIVFALDKNSDDYNEIRKHGKVINPESLKYKMCFLQSDFLISAYADGLVNNPFREFSFLIKDLKKCRFVYLQHGIMQGELSNWLNVLSKDIKLLVTSTKMETESIINGDFGYSEKEVKLLGSPRFDELFKYENKKKIVIMPTWRDELAGSIIPGTRERRYVYDFKQTDYCRFYNSLINDEKLARILNENGYECEFYLHPNFLKQADDFIGNESVKVITENAKYDKVLGESAVLITDYSGIQFDFAYQKKPLIYSHYDDLYAGGQGHHTYQKTYFDYSTQGFGPIAHTVDQVVSELEKILNNAGEMEEKYKQRVDGFFYYNDQNNSKRVYEQLCNM